MALTDLPALLRDEPSITGLLGRRAALLAVPEPARPLTIAGLATVGSRRPILVAVPTTAEAERLVHDLGTFLGPDAADRRDPTRKSEERTLASKSIFALSLR